MNQWWVLQCQTKNVVSPALTAPCAWLPEVASKPDLRQRIRSHLKREWERVVPQALSPQPLPQEPDLEARFQRDLGSPLYHRNNATEMEF